MLVVVSTVGASPASGGPVGVTGPSEPAVVAVTSRSVLSDGSVRSAIAQVFAQTTVRVRYVAPVDAPVVDRFRPPEGPYGPGNRGWEYATTPHTEVRAAADGTVAFAGQVGPAFAVTLRHADGLRTSYSQLSTVLVRTGDSVPQGSPVGRSSDQLHFGVRRGDTYVDPATLFAPVRGRPRLIPLPR